MNFEIVEIIKIKKEIVFHSFKKKFLIIIFTIYLYKYNIFILNKKGFKEDNFESYLDAFNNAKDFINNNLQGILLNNNILNASKNPKISVIIPCHNCQGNILKTIRSIQNQNFMNLEIIVVNDFSIDHSLSILEQLKREDLRLSIINNKRNMGTLYTRSIGILSSKGYYLFNIDSDDMILNNDIFSRTTKIADKWNFDIIIFNSIITDLKPNLHSTKIKIHYDEKFRKKNLVLFQPELGYYPVIPFSNSYGFRYNEVLIFDKCIKSSIYKKALNKLGKDRISRFMILGEDNIANIITFNSAISAKFIPLYGYLHFDRKGSVSKKKMKTPKKLINNLNILDVLIDFSKDFVKNKQILINYLEFILKNKKLKIVLLRSKYKKIFSSSLKRILNCKYISNKKKLKIIKITKSLKIN